MATSMTTDFSLSVAHPIVANARVRAIEYLTDEFVHSGGTMSPRNAQIEAVQLLMGLNRQVYFECPEITTMGDRIRSMLHLHAA
jgi:hypothetical protein